MKATPTLQQAIAEKCLKNVGQPLQIILFTMLFSILSAIDGGHLLAGVPKVSSGDIFEYTPAVSFQEVQDDVTQPTIEWDKTFGGNGYEFLNNVISTPDGGYLLAGTSRSGASGDKSENKKGDSVYDSDYWIVKIDKQGNKIWDKSLRGNGDDRLSKCNQICYVG